MSRVLGDTVGSIGENKPSMLTLAQFQALYGPGWILADGSSCAGSKYAAITGFTTVPDHRGVGLRGKNNGRSDGNQNPDGELALGSFQSDAFGSHNHGGGSHVHDVRVVNYNTNPDGEIGPKGDSPYAPDHPGTVTSAPNSTVIQMQGGNETRMKNNTVNIFIRIN